MRRFSLPLVLLAASAVLAGCGSSTPSGLVERQTKNKDKTITIQFYDAKKGSSDDPSTHFTVTDTAKALAGCVPLTYYPQCKK